MSTRTHFSAHQVKICILSTLIVFLSALFILIPQAHALDFRDATTKFTEVGNTAYGAPQPTLTQTVGRVIRGALALVGVIFLALMVYAGFRWMTSQGEEQAVTKAKDTIITAIIGLFVVMAAYAITFYVTEKLMTGTNATTNATNTG